MSDGHVARSTSGRGHGTRAIGVEEMARQKAGDKEHEADDESGRRSRVRGGSFGRAGPAQRA